MELFDINFYNIEKGNNCCICLEPVENKYIFMSKCRHVIHLDCLMKWFRIKAICPLCNTDQTRLKSRLNIK